MSARFIFSVLFVYSSLSFAQPEAEVYVCATKGKVVKLEVVHIEMVLKDKPYPISEIKISKTLAISREELSGQKVEAPGYEVKFDDQGSVIEVSELGLFGSTLICSPAN